MTTTDTDADVALRREAEDEVSRAVVRLIREEPFYGHLLSGINRDFSARTPTAGVAFKTGRPLLSVNPEFFIERLEPDERVAVIKHEVLHLLLDHTRRIDIESMNRRVYNLAADLVVNQLIGRWPLPDGAILLDTFGFPLPPDMTLDWYYGELMKHAEEVPKELQPEHSDHDSWSDGDDSEGSIERHELARVVRDAKDRSGARFDDLPAEVQQLVDTLIRELEPAVDWRRVLRMFTQSSRRTRVANTLRRPSKRYGTFPGIKVKRFHRLAVIIDTSGSVDDDMLSAFFAEVRTMWRQGSEVTIVEADATVQRTWEYRGDRPTAIGGRGGTRFDPALQWVADASPPFDGAIYLTDGDAAPPTVRPRCKVLWVLPEGAKARSLDGERVVRITR